MEKVKRGYVRTSSTSKIADRNREEQRNERKKKKEQRLIELEEWLMENSFTDPQFQEKVYERNNILATL